MSLTALSRYDDAEDEIKDEDHNLVATATSLPASSKDSESDTQSASELPSRPSSTQGNKPKSLVSYIGEYSDDENSSSEEEDDCDTPSSKLSVANLFDGSSIVSSVGSNSPNDILTQNVETMKTKDTVRLPPQPEGHCSKSLQENIVQKLEKKKQGLNVNEYIQSKKDFRNPSIYDKLVNFIGIDEHGTNFPRHLYDPSVWGPESYYDELAKTQKEHHDKKEKEKQKRTHVEFIKGTKKVPVVAPVPASASTNPATEKKSKWDQKSQAAN